MEQSKSIKEILDTYGKYTGLTIGHIYEAAYSRTA